MFIIFLLDNDDDTDNDAPFAPVLENFSPRRPDSCVVCLAEPTTHACIPCGHKCLCENCSTEQINRCPLCQGELIMIVQIYN